MVIDLAPGEAEHGPASRGHDVLAESISLERII